MPKKNNAQVELPFTLRTLDDLDVTGKRVFLRADLNVPIVDGKMVSDFKLQAVLPTIKEIQKRGGTVILATHLGRPSGEDKRLSTKVFAPWFKEHEVEDIEILENLRFNPGEQTGDEGFAQQLRALADCYVSESVGTLHRDDTSTTLLPSLFEHRAAGPLLIDEVTKLYGLRVAPKQPFIVVVGGNKTADKLPLLAALIAREEAARPKAILIGGAMAYTFLAAQGVDVAGCPVEQKALAGAASILEHAHSQGVTIVLPKDSIVASEGQTDSSTIAPVGHFPSGQSGVDIGPATIDTFTKKIEHAKTIFVNGTMGIYTNEMYADGTKHVFEAIATSHAKSYVGGGDAVAAALTFKNSKKYAHLSTGGGAALAILACDDVRDLPGLRELVKE